MIIGLTGGIGSGKSVVASIFEKLGTPVYQSDRAVHRMYDHNISLIEFIRNEISQNVFEKNGKINRKKLGEVVFNNQGLLNKLDEVIHPMVKDDFNKWTNDHKGEGFVIKETAILFESASYKDCDKTICVVSNIELRYERIKSRDNKSKAEIDLIMSRQLKDDELIKRSDFVIYNNEEQLIIPQVIKIHGVIKNM